jgi:hypothetical protein
MSEFIDPEELPFTEDEVCQAGCLFLPADAARAMAATLAECGPGVIVAREERRAAWRAAGMVETQWMPLHAWAYPKDLLPALASLSPDVASRAQFMMEARWQCVYQYTIGRLQQEALEAAGLVPSRAELIQRATAAAVTKKAKRELKVGLVVQGPPPPLPTTAMVVAAHAAVAAERVEWAAHVERFLATSPSRGTPLHTQTRPDDAS